MRLSKRCTHKELVDIGYNWILKNTPCTIAFKELVTSNNEIPDVIGFNSNSSVLIECKTSRTDFMRDRCKPFRSYPNEGMGGYRYYLTPENTINEDELPPSWGLLEVDEKGVVRTKKKAHSRWFTSKDQLPKNTEAEYRLMYSVLRRLPRHILEDLREDGRPETLTKQVFVINHGDNNTCYVAADNELDALKTHYDNSDIAIIHEYNNVQRVRPVDWSKINVLINDSDTVTLREYMYKYNNNLSEIINCVK